MLMSQSAIFPSSLYRWLWELLRKSDLPGHNTHPQRSHADDDEPSLQTCCLRALIHQCLVVDWLPHCVDAIIIFILSAVSSLHGGGSVPRLHVPTTVRITPCITLLFGVSFQAGHLFDWCRRPILTCVCVHLLMWLIVKWIASSLSL